MIDFNKIQIEEPNFKEFTETLIKLKDQLDNASSSDDAIKVIEDYFKFSDHLQSICTIINIRHTINISDEKYSKYNDLLNEKLPLLNEYENKVTKAILHSKFRKELEEKFGTYYFKQLELADKIFSPEIIPDLQEENNLVAKYQAIMGQASAIYKGQELPLTKFNPYLTNLDRQVRKESSKAYWSFFSENEDKLAELYSKLVTVRDRVAKKLGFKNFIQLAYYRLGRIDYNQDDVKNYRDEVLKNIVPLANKLRQLQMKRIGIKDPQFYDYALAFKTGNPLPLQDPNKLIEAAKIMYKEMNSQISYYFDFMVKYHLMDLIAKPGKVPGGYMTFIPDIKSSFIFSNFNGSAGDVDVLTHEFGHSLQGFLSANIEVPSLRNPGMESCEIHSMSMEFLTYKFMNLFFNDQADKYRFSHLEDAIEFIPYGVSVDEFQHFVYENPQATHQERKAKWREIEKKYTPYKNYDENDFLLSGGLWMRQGHIYEVPFYYIDYTIAQVGAFEFFTESLENYPKTLDKYLNFCKLGGQYPYKTLMTKAGIKNPMVNGTLEEITPKLEKYLNSIDTSKF